VRIAALFPGQGSQVVGMGDAWTAHPAARSVLEEVSAGLGRDVVEGCRDDGALATTAFVQPALLACDVAVYRVMQAEGVEVGAAAGHSLGEYAALVAADVLELSAAIEAVVARGRAMQAASEARAGTMTALIGAGVNAVERICEEARGEDVLAIANENASNQVVISGSPPAIERAERLATEQAIRAIRLKVAGAFHSPLMAPAADELRPTLERLPFRPARFPVAANATGELVSDGESFRGLLADQVVSPVRWEASMRTLAAAGFDTFVEAGPGQVLARIARRDLPDMRSVAVGSPEDVVVFAATVRDEVAT
jgi:[acyl-carrier-protein] S-malonyltransferase